MISDEIRDRLSNRKLVLGDLRIVRLGKDAVRVEYGESNSDGDMCACVIPNKIVEAVRKMDKNDRRQLVQWFGFEARYEPQLFSRRLNDFCCPPPGRRYGFTTKLAKILGRSPMCVSHWRSGHALPSDPQAQQIAELLGWDVEHVLADVRYERGQKAIAEQDRRAKQRQSRVKECA